MNKSLTSDLTLIQRLMVSQQQNKKLKTIPGRTTIEV